MLAARTRTDIRVRPSTIERSGRNEASTSKFVA
jgi:hypothetical protein